MVTMVMMIVMMATVMMMLLVDDGDGDDGDDDGDDDDAGDDDDDGGDGDRPSYSHSALLFPMSICSTQPYYIHIDAANQCARCTVL